MSECRHRQADQWPRRPQTCYPPTRFICVLLVEAFSYFYSFTSNFNHFNVILFIIFVRGH